MPSIFQTFYVSSAVVPFDNVQVGAIVRAGRRNNARLDVTGCLLFSGRYFAQVLEGDASVVTALTARIGNDVRHRDVRILVERRRDEREYADWSMGYLHDASLEDDLETLLLIPGRSAPIATDVMARMRPDMVTDASR